MIIDTPLDRVCIVMMSAVGDAVHVLPVVNAIKRHSPRTHITWILQPGPAALMRGHPSVDEIVLFERRLGWRAFLDIRRKLAGRGFDLVLDLQVYLKGGIVTWLTDAAVKLGFDRARARDANWLFTTHQLPPHPVQHVQDQYFEFLQALGIPHEPVEWLLGPWADEREWQREFFSQFRRPVVSLVIGSSDRHREWLPERWAELADVLHESHGLQPVLVGGRSPRELETEDRITSLSRHSPVSTLGIPLRQLVGVLDGSALVISLNTAPLHMAVALDRPVIGLLGHFNPKRTGPYRKFHDLVLDAYGTPGEQYGVGEPHRPGGMERITVADVVEKVGLWRERYADRYPPAFPERGAGAVRPA